MELTSLALPFLPLTVGWAAIYRGAGVQWSE